MKSLNRRTHTFAKAFHNAKHYAKDAATDPYAKGLMARYKALCLAWARSDKELAKANAISE
jgi:hypothetical protein